MTRPLAPKRQPLPVFAAILLALGTAIVVQAEPTDVDITLPPLYEEAGWAPSPAVYPPQQLPLVFSHEQHVQQAGMPCTDCHADALNSERTADRLLPPMDQCLECHVLPGDPMGEETRPAECSTCHPAYLDTPPEPVMGVDRLGRDNYAQVVRPPDALIVPTANLNFSHKLHIDAEVACETCHSDMKGVGRAGRDNLPMMDDCISCHVEQDVESTACQTCHLAAADGRLVTNFGVFQLVPTGRFRPDDHRFEFVDSHIAAARADTGYCDSCHTPAMCEDCHNGVSKPLAIHPPNYTVLHSIDATQNAGSCDSCHTRQDFCVACHEQIGVGDLTRPPADAQFHPAGFIDDLGSPNFHGPQATRNISACVSCHQEDTCISCHSGLNPHPPDFTDTCGAMVTRNENACAKCHFDMTFIRQVCK